jgi:hypothetical protein
MRNIGAIIGVLVVELWKLDHCGSTLPAPVGSSRLNASVMIEKFAIVRGLVLSEFLDLNHTRKPMILVSLMIPKVAPEASLEQRRTSESGH